MVHVFFSRQYLDIRSYVLFPTSKGKREEAMMMNQKRSGEIILARFSSTRQSNDRGSESNRVMSDRVSLFKHRSNRPECRDGKSRTKCERKFPRVDRSATVQLARASASIFKSCTARRWHAEIARPWSGERFPLLLSR